MVAMRKRPLRFWRSLQLKFLVVCINASWTRFVSDSDESSLEEVDPEVFPEFRRHSDDGKVIWHYGRLMGDNGRRKCIALLTTLKDIFDSPTWTEGLQLILSMDREEFKTLSSEGLVFRKKRSYDLGNWSYALVYQLHGCYLMMSGDCKLSSDMVTLAEHYESLDINCVPSNESLSMKGDVVEVVLALARRTGVAIPPDKVRERHDIMDLFRRFEDNLEKILITTVQTENGRPHGRYLPDPAKFASLLVCALPREGNNETFMRIAADLVQNPWRCA
jgi:hypothetical protein